jgi:hypothetical protein
VRKTTVLSGIELRYALTMALAVCGPLTIVELAEELDRKGFSVNGRPSKAISDALRWEVRHGRVRRSGRGRYRSGYIPRSTEYRIWKRVLALRRKAQSSLVAWQFDNWFDDDEAITGELGDDRVQLSLVAGQFDERFDSVGDEWAGVM